MYCSRFYFSFIEFDPMFYVEHMKNTALGSFLTLFCLFLLVSCNKRDPNPELSDVVYLDLLAELEIAQKNLTSEKAQNIKTKEDLDLVTPQTGQYKFAQKRYFESLNNLDLYKQQVKYFEINLELRKHETKVRYLESLTKNGRPWPDSKEIENYKARLKLQKAKLSWGKKPEEKAADSEQEKKDVPRGTKPEGESAAPTAN
jgi:hypothetical protein